MRRVLLLLLGAVFALGCGSPTSSGSDEAGGSAKVLIAEKSFEVSDVMLRFETGSGSYFRVEGDDSAHTEDDCLPGLGGGMALYGDVPASIASAADLSGKELPFEFTGDGDDFNLCFVGSNGLLGVEQGTVRFGTVDGTRIPFTFSGTFVLYDGVGGQDPTPLGVSGVGVAHLVVD